MTVAHGLGLYYESLIPKKEEVKFSRVWQIPNKNTFEIPAIKQLLNRYLKSPSLDPFCGICTIADVRNDINESKAGQYHMRSDDFLKEISKSNQKFKTVLFDHSRTKGETMTSKWGGLA